MKLRTITILTLTVTTLALGGCSSEAEPDSAPTQEETTVGLPTEQSESTQSTEPSESSATPSPDVVPSKISRQLRGAHFPRTAPAYQTWRSNLVDTAKAAAVMRRVLPCDNARIDLQIDRRVLAHAETVFEQGDYVVSRQLTVYPDTATANQFVAQLGKVPVGCAKLKGSSDLGTVRRLGYGPDRFFRTKDSSVILSETDMTYGDNRFVYVDVINQRDNTILFTRIGSLNPSIKENGVLSNREKNAGFVRVVRGQTDRATVILRQLSSS